MTVPIDQPSLARWVRFGPYYAMFPVEFAFEVVRKYSNTGDSILDPFVGRGTTLIAACSQKRHGYGVEINPVGWLYGKVKLAPASRLDVETRVMEILQTSFEIPDSDIQALSEFFHHCFAPNVLKFLLAAKSSLNWLESSVDATLMTIILVDLHGKSGSALSNQMRQGKAMSPDYSVRWWQERNLHPPKWDIEKYFSRKIAWRYAHGQPKLEAGEILLGDSRKQLEKLRDVHNREQAPKINLLLTSPPYFAITNYLKDQWLRLWMLGGPSRPVADGDERFTRFESREEYRKLLKEVFVATKSLLAADATIYVRTDAREFTLNTTETILKSVFPEKKLIKQISPLTKPSQTALFGDHSSKPGEIDIILS